MSLVWAGQEKPFIFGLEHGEAECLLGPQSHISKEHHPLKSRVTLYISASVGQSRRDPVHGVLARTKWLIHGKRLEHCPELTAHSFCVLSEPISIIAQRKL